MTKDRRWLKSAIQAAGREEVFLPWAHRRAANIDMAFATAPRDSSQPPSTLIGTAFPFSIAAR